MLRENGKKQHAKLTTATAASMAMSSGKCVLFMRSYEKDGDVILSLLQLLLGQKNVCESNDAFHSSIRVLVRAPERWNTWLSPVTIPSADWGGAVVVFDQPQYSSSGTRKSFAAVNDSLARQMPSLFSIGVHLKKPIIVPESIATAVVIRA